MCIKVCTYPGTCHVQILLNYRLTTSDTSTTTTYYSRSPQVLVGHLAKTTNQSLVQYTEEYKNTCVKECVKEYKYPGVCGTFVVRGTWYVVRGTWYLCVRGTVTVTVSFCCKSFKIQ